MKAINPASDYLSTRQSAKILQVSLGTVQKMVEVGELIAWKTYGGHRRILASSLEKQLTRRKQLMRQKLSTHCVVMAIFRRTENREELQEICRDWSLQVDLIWSLDSLEGLMQAVSSAPDLIYLDAFIPPVEQVHIIHYLSKNELTQRIPILVDEGFVELHPGVIQLAGENSGVIQPQPNAENASSAQNQNILENPLILGYPANHSQLAKQQLEQLFVEALSRKYDWA
ncbi:MULTISPECIES: helix-turn-helix domain-containing protein [unclassified Polynucleobacter]|uniref:excisionase family DNA-binding protein n=1 Tax=unclassified Polynucleobacter TaxID=2640945 RepID=UPI001F4656EB|nr:MULTISPECIES: helix-turn-helix domain-containing protein [unclassified Polynucleobacter]MCE7527348.1 excisionase family DNA-binding protein [Polynucleobacter sp. IMCC 30228]MCE7528788.1 excisionase family DNA-binding protein [Polynucleobacter sp. IMCC 29146]